MGSLISLLSTVVAGDVGHTVSRYKRDAALSALAILFFATAYIVLLIAGAVYLSIRIDPLTALLIIGLGAVLTGLVIVSVMAILRAGDRRRQRERNRRSMARTNLIAATAFALVRRKPLMAVGVATALGLLLSFARSGESSDD